MVTLLTRGLSIIPILSDQNRFFLEPEKNKQVEFAFFQNQNELQKEPTSFGSAHHESKCQEMLFNGSPVILFIIAIFINSYRWSDILSMLIHGQHLKRPITIFVWVIVTYMLSLMIAGYVLF